MFRPQISLTILAVMILHFFWSKTLFTKVVFKLNLISYIKGLLCLTVQLFSLRKSCYYKSKNNLLRSKVEKSAYYKFSYLK